MWQMIDFGLWQPANEKVHKRINYTCDGFTIIPHRPFDASKYCVKFTEAVSDSYRSATCIEYEVRCWLIQSTLPNTQCTYREIWDRNRVLHVAIYCRQPSDRLLLVDRFQAQIQSCQFHAYRKRALLSVLEMAPFCLSHKKMDALTNDSNKVLTLTTYCVEQRGYRTAIGWCALPLSCPLQKST